LEAAGLAAKQPAVRGHVRLVVGSTVDNAGECLKITLVLVTKRFGLAGVRYEGGKIEWVTVGTRSAGDLASRSQCFYSETRVHGYRYIGVIVARRSRANGICETK